MSASPALQIEPGSPQAWREAFLGMKPSVGPCGGLTAKSSSAGRQPQAPQAGRVAVIHPR
ncbi:hypothetical protein FPV16_20365 [Methylobacterium sp. W2]|nr:hypothetical protein [Methylobacterium sp. W2]